MPVTWSDVESDKLRPDGVGIRNISEWFRGRDDPWKSMERSQKPLPSLAASELPDRSGRRKGVSKKAVR
jgi:DNA primase